MKNNTTKTTKLGACIATSLLITNLFFHKKSKTAGLFVAGSLLMGATVGCSDDNMGGPGGGHHCNVCEQFSDFKLAFDNLLVTRGPLGVVSNGGLQFVDTLSGVAKMFTKHGGRAERGETIVYKFNNKCNSYVSPDRFPICSQGGVWRHAAPGFEGSSDPARVFIPAHITQEMCNR